MSFKATDISKELSNARYTSPKPPPPSFFSSLYRSPKLNGKSVAEN